MKKLYYLMLCMAIGLSATSCLSDKDNDNNYKVLTKADKEAQLRDMAGIYNGHILFINDTTSKTDSLNISWQVTPHDSTLTVRNFPLKILAQGLPKSASRDLLMQEGGATFSATLHPYAVNSNTEGFYAFWVIPRDYKMEFTLDHEDVSHEVEVEFTDGMTAYTTGYMTEQFYAYGLYLNHEMGWYVLVKSVTVDKTKYMTGRAMLVNGKK